MKLLFFMTLNAASVAGLYSSCNLCTNHIQFMGCYMKVYTEYLTQCKMKSTVNHPSVNYHSQH